MAQASHPPPHGAETASWCSNTGTPPDRTRIAPPTHPRVGRSALPAKAHTVTFFITVSAEAVGSWTRRLSHHLLTPCELWGAQTPARRPHRLDLRFRCALGESARRGSQERFRRPLATVTRPRRRLGWSDHGSGDCPTTTWYRVSSGMPKFPPAARTDA
jgi:hypothetical protein